MNGRRRQVSERRTPDDDDIGGWYNAADERRSRPATRQEILALLEKKNSYRMWRIRHDIKWLRRQLKKMGYNPDDVRDLL